MKFISDRPETKEELFNLRHASARNAIERGFGVMKKRCVFFLSSEESLIEHMFFEKVSNS